MIMELMLHDEDGNDNLCKGGYRDIDKGGGEGELKDFVLSSWVLNSEISPGLPLPYIRP